MPEYQFDKVQLLEAIRHDCRLFLSFYLGDELTLDVPEFHEELWDEFLLLLDEINEPDRLVGILQKLLGVPREHAKTTLVKLAIILFLRYSRLSFVAYISSTFGTALNALKDIESWLTCAQEVELYGAPVRIKSSETSGEFIYDICIPGQQKKKRVILKAFGQGTQIRGTVIHSRRPDLMVFDDVESHETANSPQQQSKLDTWCLGTAMKSMAKLGVCIFIGNMIADTTLLARLAKEAAWKATVFGAIIRDASGSLRPLWEGRWTLEALIDDYAAYARLGQAHVWEAEMMNLTGRQIFGRDLSHAIRPEQPNPEQVEAGFICLDPAFGLNAWNDESAITVHVRMIGGQIPVVVDSVHGRYGEEQLFEEMLAASWRWGLTTWVIEAQAAQRLLIPLFRAYFIQRGMSADMFLMLPVVAGKESKASRIMAFRESVANGSYAVSDSMQEIIDKLGVYAPDTKDHDDVCDSSAMGAIVWHLHGTMIEQNGRVNIAGGIISNGSGAQSYGSADMNIP